MSKFKKLTMIIISLLIVISIVGVIANRYLEKNYTIASAGQYKTAITESNQEMGAEITFTPSITGVHMGDTVTITISAKCETGLGGLDAILDWDETKLKFTNQSAFQLSGIDEATGKFNLAVLYDGDEQEAVLATLEFEVLDTATVGEVLSIDFTEIEIIDNNIDSIGLNDVSVALNVVDHSFTSYTSNNDATCTVDGTKTAKCDKCDEISSVTDVGSVLGHNHQKTASTAPTCTEKGAATYTCLRCQDTYTAAEGDATGHSFTSYTSNGDATCTVDGTKTAQCDKCDEVDTITDAGSATGHSFTTYVSNNDATCTEDGTKTAKCDKCDEKDTVTDEGSAKGHNYENWKCTGCGKDAERITVTSEKYEIAEQYITKISNKTTLKNLKESLVIANAKEISVLDKNNEPLTENDFVGTGATLILKSEIETKTLKLVVAGDTTGDGVADFKDMVAINRHRLNQKLLQGEYLMAGEVTGNDKVGFEDIVKINRFRLNKIVELFVTM